MNVLMTLVMATVVSQAAMAASKDCGKIESSTKLSGLLAEQIFYGQNRLGGSIDAQAGGSNGITAGSVEVIEAGHIRMLRVTEVNLQTKVRVVNYSVQLDSWANLNLKNTVKSLIDSAADESSAQEIAEMNQCFQAVFNP